MKDIHVTRFWQKVNKSGSCWEWRASRNRKGYGFAWMGDAQKSAHRVAYELTVGPIPDGLHLDHLCRNTGCVNPEHLEPVTPAENNRRSPSCNSRKTECSKGHQFTEENTYKDANGWRTCRTCERARDRRRDRSARRSRLSAAQAG